MKIVFKIILITAVSFSSKGQSLNLNSYRWTPIEAEGEVVGRHENVFFEYNKKFYLIGGKGINPVDVFDPATNTWKPNGKTPVEIHHFQPVVYGNAVYLLGAMTGKFPKETPIENIWIYYPDTDQWVKGAEIPENRRRGGAGTVLYNDKIYLSGGIKFGHTSGTTNYFDSYDLKTGKWEILTDAPHIRDHFPAIVANDKLYCIGGRNTSVHYPDNFLAFFSATIPDVDYYDFKEGKWFTLKDPLPIPTAAGGLVKIDNCLIYAGGEGGLPQAYNNTQCFDLNTAKWTQLAPLNTGRHGSGAIYFDNKIYTAAGSPNKGGGSLSSVEVFSLNHNWEKLFNGDNLDGWQIKTPKVDKNNKFWTVDNGAILCNSMPSSNYSTTWLMSDKEFGDFELRLKFKVSREHKGNLGIQVRSRYDPKAVVDGKNLGWMDGPKIEIDPNNIWRNGLIFDETRTENRWIFPSLIDSKIIKENTLHPKKVFFWEDEIPGCNDMIIVCKGNYIKTFVNNFLVADYDGNGVLDNENHTRYNVGLKGHIAFQLQKNAENKIWFKDIEVRELK